MTNDKETVLVTGGTGFVGQHIVKHLMMNADWVQEVRILDMRPFEKHLGLSLLLTQKFITYMYITKNTLYVCLYIPSFVM